MTRRSLAIPALACLLVLAGCSGVLGPGNAPSDGANGSATTSPATPTADDTANPIYEPPLSATTVLDEHASALRDAETFSYTQSSRFRGVNGSGFLQQTTVDAAVDLTGDRTRIDQNVTLQGSSEGYGNASVGYLRLATDDGPRYRRAPGNLTDPALYTQPPIGRYVRGLNWSYRGATERNGTTVHTYVVGGTDQLSPTEHGLRLIAPENVTGIDARLSLTDEGRIDSFEYRARGVVRGVLVEYDLSLGWNRVGSTTVSEPDWLPDARNATAG